MQAEFCDKNAASARIGISLPELKRLRLKGELRRGIHWIAYGPRKVLFNLPLLLDWLQNRESPELHEKAIEAYLASLPSSQAVATKGRKAS